MKALLNRRRSVKAFSKSSKVTKTIPKTKIYFNNPIVVKNLYSGTYAYVPEEHDHDGVLP